jgi:hypothetical protein
VPYDNNSNKEAHAMPIGVSTIKTQMLENTLGTNKNVRKYLRDNHKC